MWHKLTYIEWSFRVFAYLWIIILLISSQLTGPWTLPQVRVKLFSKIHLFSGAYGCMSTLIMGWGPSLFNLQEAFLSMCRQGSLCWTQEWAPYLSALAELSFATSFVLGCLGENKAWILLDLTNTRCPAQRHTISYLTKCRFPSSLCLGFHVCKMRRLWLDYPWGRVKMNIPCTSRQEEVGGWIEHGWTPTLPETSEGIRIVHGTFSDEPPTVTMSWEERDLGLSRSRVRVDYWV